MNKVKYSSIDIVQFYNLTIIIVEKVLTKS